MFHQRNAGLPANLAWGLATFLNSTPVDQLFRQFNGHTQVNATDLRSLRYPSTDDLTALGRAARTSEPLQQRDIDDLLGVFVPD
ncbi:MAG: SAM-dependent methyltransferase, partial [Actinomycetota bacterium]